jgi:hypothetical protein
MRAQLEALADELEGRGRAGTAKALKAFDLGRLLAAALADEAGGTAEGLDRELGGSGEAAGYQAAARAIRAALEGR